MESAGTNFYAGDLVSIVLTNSDSRKALRDVRLAGWPLPPVAVNYTNGGLITNLVAVNTGFATVTAYGYDENGEAVQSNPIFLAIRPANDLVERAIEIPAAPLATEVFEGDASYGALEAAEPPPDSPLLPGSVWWKWTPNETGSRVIRLTLPFSIYTRPPRLAVFERAQGDWIRVEDNFDWELHRSYGVYFDAKAGTAYWIQAFGAEWTSMIKFRIESVATKSYFIAGGSLSAQSGEWKTLVTDAAGNLMDGEISVQTYAGTNESSLAPIGGGMRLSGPGVFPVAGQLIENVAPGTELYVQIRAWQSYCPCGLYARTFEAAEALGLMRGISPLGRVITAADVTNASAVNALANVTMQTDRTPGTLAPVEIRWLTDGGIELTSAAAIVHSYTLERFMPETGWTVIGEATNGLNRVVFNDPVTNQSAIYRTRIKSIE